MKTKILVIEDDLLLRSNLIDFLEAEKFKVIPAANSYIGLHLAKQEEPDVIICEEQMPHLKGSDFIEKLHEIFTTAAIPVILLIDEEFQPQEPSFLTEPNAYVTKPLMTHQLLEVISSVL